MTRTAWWMMPLLLAGCARPVTFEATSLPVSVLSPAHPAAIAQPVAAPLASAPQNPAPATPATDPQWGLLKAIGQQGGLVGDLGGLVPDAPEGYQTQIVPATSQDDAELRAHHWASDARQAYVGWGFWKTSLLGRTRHMYYSPSRNQCLKLEYNVLRNMVSAYQNDGGAYGKAFLVLRDSYDNHGYTAKQAYSVARDAGYRPGKYAMGVLFNLVLIGPVWVFLDDTASNAIVAVQADSGEAITGGLRMEALQYMVGQGDDVKHPGNPWQSIPTPPLN